MEKYDGMKEKLKLWMKYKKDELIPPEVIIEFNNQKEQSKQDYYIKRSVELDFDSDFRAMMDFPL